MLQHNAQLHVVPLRGLAELLVKRFIKYHLQREPVTVIIIKMYTGIPEECLTVE